MNGKPLRIALVVVMVCVAILGSSVLVSADSVSAQGGPSRSIVVFEAGTTSMAAQQAIVARAGGQWVKALPLVNAAVVVATPASERALKAQGNVLRVEEDAVAQALGKPDMAQGKPSRPTPQPSQTVDWGVDRINADLVWSTNTGAGVKVAVVDTGIDVDHADLKANVEGGYNAINPRKSYNDDNGHGTHVAGTIAALNNTIGVVGVAPGASLYAVKVLGANGSGYVSDIIEGLDWCITNGIRVVNMSLGTTSDVLSFHQAVTRAYNAGIVLVAAAGNSGPGSNTVEYPGAYYEVIAVAAVDSTSTVAYFSSRGNQVELAGPGVSILSTYNDGGYRTLSGTSMASPHVAGTAALVIASGITGRDAVRAKLTSTADDLGATGKDTLYGYGLVDADGAALGTTP